MSDRLRADRAMSCCASSANPERKSLECLKCVRFRLDDPGNTWNVSVGTSDLLHGMETCAGCEVVYRAAAALEAPVGSFIHRDTWGPRGIDFYIKDQGGEVHDGFQIYRTSEDAQPVWRALQVLPNVYNEPIARAGSDEACQKIQNWLEDCKRDHESCESSAATAWPTRLIDVGFGQAASLRLVETSPDDPLPYVALSHCWGNPEAMAKTTTTNLDAQHEEILGATLSRTFQDAVSICRRLLFRYLWIDALCIVQDDHEDWLREASCMYGIYTDASLTLAATASADGRGGCWMPNSWNYSVHLAPGEDIDICVRRSHPKGHAVFLSTDELAELKAPLARRKWTLQERLLSRRIVHFSATELVWQCRQQTLCECEGFDLNGAWYTDKHNVALVNGTRALEADQWCVLVRAYARADITGENDTLPAIAGLARLYGEYHLGE
ncbi:hypothetical protein LTR95_011655 [Oleoguttula sp. CCFEE 5521]